MGSKLDLYGEDFLRVLMRRQFALSCTVAGVLASALAVLLLLNRLAADALDTRVIGLPVSWWLLGIGVFPLLVGLGWAYVRRSNDFEDEAIGMVDVATLPQDTRGGRTPRQKR